MKNNKQKKNNPNVQSQITYEQKSTHEDLTNALACAHLFVAHHSSITENLSLSGGHTPNWPMYVSPPSVPQQRGQHPLSFSSLGCRIRADHQARRQRDKSCLFYCVMEMHRHGSYKDLTPYIILLERCAGSRNLFHCGVTCDGMVGGLC